MGGIYIKVADYENPLRKQRKGMRDSIKLWCRRRPAGGKQQSTGLLH